VASLLGAVHHDLVFNRRTRVLSEELARAMPDTGSVLDVGCGDGTIDALIGTIKPGLHIRGIDVMKRPTTHIPVETFDGSHFPVPDNSYDVVSFCDVLHHTPDPNVLLREARRVARKAVVIKDHNADGLFAFTRLRFMDWVGNAPHGVVLPYNYWTEAQWRGAFADIGLTPTLWNADIPLYPFPASAIFGSGLHFVTSLGVGKPG
jgi:SAM-dependent methyltransferase